MIHLVWGFSLLFSSILVFFYFKKDNRVTVKYLCLFGALIGAILGILNIFGSSGIWSDKSIKYEKKPL